MLVWISTLNTIRVQGRKVNVTKECQHLGEYSVERETTYSTGSVAALASVEMQLYSEMAVQDEDARNQIRFWQHVVGRELHDEAHRQEVQGLSVTTGRGSSEFTASISVS
eukprot:3824713-Amphidinium_carterae.1